MTRPQTLHIADLCSVLRTLPTLVEPVGGPMP